MGTNSDSASVKSKSDEEKTSCDGSFKDSSTETDLAFPIDNKFEPPNLSKEFEKDSNYDITQEYNFNPIPLPEMHFDRSSIMHAPIMNSQIPENQPTTFNPLHLACQPGLNPASQFMFQTNSTISRPLFFFRGTRFPIHPQNFGPQINQLHSRIGGTELPEQIPIYGPLPNLEKLQGQPPNLIYPQQLSGNSLDSESNLLPNQLNHFDNSKFLRQNAIDSTKIAKHPLKLNEIEAKHEMNFPFMKMFRKNIESTLPQDLPPTNQIQGLCNEGNIPSYWNIPTFNPILAGQIPTNQTTPFNQVPFNYQPMPNWLRQIRPPIPTELINQNNSIFSASTNFPPEYGFRFPLPFLDNRIFNGLVGENNGVEFPGQNQYFIARQNRDNFEAQRLMQLNPQLNPENSSDFESSQMNERGRFSDLSKMRNSGQSLNNSFSQNNSEKDRRENNAVFHQFPNHQEISTENGYPLSKQLELREKPKELFQSNEIQYSSWDRNTGKETETLVLNNDYNSEISKGFPFMVRSYKLNFKLKFR